MGASSGIGRALALRAGAGGARVAVAARRLELVEEAGAGDRRVRRRGAGVALRRHRRGRRAPGWSTTRPPGWAASTSSSTCRAAPRSCAWPRTPRRRCGTRCWPRTWWGRRSWSPRALAHLRGAARPVVVVTTHSMGAPWPWLGVYGTTKAALAELARAPALRGAAPARGVRRGREHGYVVRRALGPRGGGPGLRAVGGRRAVALRGPAGRRDGAAIWPPCSTERGPDELLIAGADTSAASPG